MRLKHRTERSGLHPHRTRYVVDLKHTVHAGHIYRDDPVITLRCLDTSDYRRGIDPRRPQDLIAESGGRTRLTGPLERKVRAFLTRYRLAGYDMEIRSAEYVPLEIELELCVAPGHFVADVVEAVLEALSARVNPNGSRGFFHPEHFTFGQAVYLSRLYAAVEAVEGVDSVVVTRFQRYGEMENDELASALLPIGSWEIARLDNDPNFMENGVLRIAADGAK